MSSDEQHGWRPAHNSRRQDMSSHAHSLLTYARRSSLVHDGFQSSTWEAITPGSLSGSSRSSSGRPWQPGAPFGDVAQLFCGNLRGHRHLGRDTENWKTGAMSLPPGRRPNAAEGGLSESPIVRRHSGAAPQETLWPFRRTSGWQQPERLDRSVLGGVVLHPEPAREKFFSIPAHLSNSRDCL